MKCELLLRKGQENEATQKVTAIGPKNLFYESNETFSDEIEPKNISIIDFHTGMLLSVPGEFDQQSDLGVGSEGNKVN